MFVLIADVPRYGKIAERYPKTLNCGPETTKEQAIKLADELSYIEPGCNNLYIPYELQETELNSVLVEIDG